MKDYLVCIDSDGCAIDSMEIKHRRCFGPYIVEVWHLEQWKESILNRWNTMNLYSMTRGINRFLGLEKMLSEIDEHFCEIDGIKEYTHWCENTVMYSNDAIKEEIKNGASEIFHKVLEWSEMVNRGVEEIYTKIKPFDGVKNILEFMHKQADIAVVSSANPKAVQDEWTRFGLMEHVDYVMAQDAGKKTDCINQLLNKGYETKCVLMLGDAIGDLKAAQENGVAFYPILAGKECESWKSLEKKYFNDFIDGNFTINIQKYLENQFICNLQRPQLL